MFDPPTHLAGTGRPDNLEEGRLGLDLQRRVRVFVQNITDEINVVEFLPISGSGGNSAPG